MILLQIFDQDRKNPGMYMSLKYSLPFCFFYLLTKIFKRFVFSIYDSALILGEDQNSLEQALKIFDYFSICARLRVNLDKIEAILIDSKLSSDQNKSMRKTFSLEYF
jgi:hypothetical protein